MRRDTQAYMRLRRASRNVIVQVRVSAADAARLRRVAVCVGGSVAMVLRNIIRRPDLLGLCGWTGIVRVSRRGPTRGPRAVRR